VLRLASIRLGIFRDPLPVLWRPEILRNKITQNVPHFFHHVYIIAQAAFNVNRKRRLKRFFFTFNPNQNRLQRGD
jgi:hypothetical protein